MLYTMPDYYKEFQCRAGDCEETCCAGWQIVADQKALKQYRKVQGSFKKQLRKGIDWKHHCFRQDEEKRCVFLNEENLCEMYTNLGEKSLCRTCRTYPRHIEEFEDTREITLSVSCPEVARMLMNHPEPVRFQSIEGEGEEEYEDFDPFLFSELQDTRDVLYKILQNRKLSLDVRMGLAYGIVYDVQKRINRRELFSIEEVLKKYQSDRAAAFVDRRVRQIKRQPAQGFAFRKDMFHRLFKLELLKESWGLLLLQTEKLVFLSKTPEEERELTEEFLLWMEEQDMHWEIRKEQLLVYFISTYFCGAVYDGQAFEKMEMALFCTDCIESILKARWMLNEKILYEEELIDLICRFSREVEHSDYNLKKLEKMMPKLSGQKPFGGFCPSASGS